MTRATKIVLFVFAILIVGGSWLLSRSDLDMHFAARGNLENSPRVVNLNDMPGTPSKLPVLADAMPPFQGITQWWNTADGQALTPASLKGKVVLVDFWTYSCINCIRTYPFLRQMHERYADKGLVIVGVHTPEFAFEKDPENVAREIEKDGLKYPIALDPAYATWNAYRNRYWPASYLFDREGRLRRTHFGEGEYEESEKAIRELLAEGAVELGADEPTAEAPDFSKIRTPETYFGLARGNEFVGTASVEAKAYTPTERVPANEWSAGGTWVFADEYAEAQSKDAIFRFNVQAAKLHLVLESSDKTDKRIEILVDGVKTGEMTVNASDLYDIANFPDGGRHMVEIRILDGGVRFYAATFS